MNRTVHALYLLLVVPFILCMTIINLAHPALHFLEGGSLDATIQYLTALAAQLSNERRQ